MKMSKVAEALSASEGPAKVSPMKAVSTFRQALAGLKGRLKRQGVTSGVGCAAAVEPDVAVREPRAYPQAPLRVEGAAQPILVGADPRTQAGRGTAEAVVYTAGKVQVEPVEPLAGVWHTTATKSAAGVPQRSNLSPSKRAARRQAGADRCATARSAYVTYTVK